MMWIASGNKAKVNELIYFSNKFFSDYGPKTAREPKDVIESELTFKGNAKLKAVALARELIAEGNRNFVVLGDDSGLAVDLLDGRPGVQSARYSGAGSTPQKNLEKLLFDLNQITLDLNKRTGRYVCVLFLVKVADGKINREYFSEGVLEGLVNTVASGANGYAYDPIFLDPKTLKSYGDISFEEKQIDSHRFRAIEKLKKLVENN